MRRQIIIPVLFGLAGAAILIGLGVWQVQRLAWKEAILADIDMRIAAAPVDLPAQPDPVDDRYLPVRVSGGMDEAALRVLVSRKQVGAGYRIISALDTGQRRLLIDRGFLRNDETIPPPPPGEVTITGNLHWPDDRSSATPDNDVAGNIWFARDIALMADTLGTEPLLLVARETSFDDSPITPMPVDSAGIANDHLQYAITWFLLALVWLAMTGYFLMKGARAAKG